MFEMNDEQQQAFINATQGLTASEFSHTLLLIIGFIVVVWLLLLLLSVSKELVNHHLDLGDAIVQLVLASFISICVGIIIYI